MKTETLEVKIRGMICRSCVGEVEELLLHTRGVISVRASYVKSAVHIEYDNAIITPDELAARLREGGFEPGARRGSALIADALCLAAAALLTWWLLNIGGGALDISDGAPLWAVFLAGLFQSPHCVGMCGGIALGVCTGEKAPAKAALLYNAGRVAAYTLMGALFGALGAVIAYSASVKSMVFTMVGLVVALIGLNMWGLVPGLRALASAPLPCRLPSGARRRFAKRPLIVGALTGLMPCGSLYAMWLHAVSGGGWAYGAASMLAFALGTVPLLALFASLGAFIPRKWNKYMLKAGAVLVTAMGTKMLIAGLRMG